MIISTLGAAQKPEVISRRAMIKGLTLPEGFLPCRPTVSCFVFMGLSNVLTRFAAGGCFAAAFRPSAYNRSCHRVSSSSLTSISQLFVAVVGFDILCSDLGVAQELAVVSRRPGR